MKKILSTVLVCVLLLGCVFSLASCFGAKPNSDPEAAKKALEDADYKVYAQIKDGVGLISATKVDIDLEDFESEEDMEAAMKDAEFVYIVYLPEDADVDEAYEEAKEEFEEAKEKYDIKIKIGKDGNMIWYGTKAAIKAAK